MKRVFQLVVVGVIAAMVFGCSKGDDDDDDNQVTVAPALQEDGGDADFSCVGTADPFTGGIGTITLDATLETPLATGGENPVEGATVVQIDPETLAETYAVSAAADTAGATTVEVDANARVALRLDGPVTPDFIPTYYFNNITPAAAPASDDFLVISNTIYGAFIALIGFSTDDLVGTGQISGAVTDCAGETIANTVLEVTGATPVFVGYFNEGGTPDKNAVHTPGNGQFLLVGVPPSSGTFRVVAKAYTGTEAEGIPDTEVAEAFVQSQADQITIGIVSPIFN